MELPRGARVTHSGLMQHHSDGTTDIQKITQAGLVARSPEGTAAKGMNIRGNEDLWVEIQANTFRNWVNEHLRDVDLQVCQFCHFKANTQKSENKLALCIIIKFHRIVFIVQIYANEVTQFTRVSTSES